MNIELRRTGRTTRMLQEALAICESGELIREMPILIIGANKNHTDMLRNMFRNLGGWSPMREDTTVLFRSIEQCVSLRFGYGRIFREIFIDHFVYEEKKYGI